MLTDGESGERKTGMPGGKNQQDISDRYKKSPFSQEEKFSRKKFTTTKRQVSHLIINKDVRAGFAESSALRRDGADLWKSKRSTVITSKWETRNETRVSGSWVLPGQSVWRVLDHGTVQCGMYIRIKRFGTHIRRPGQ